MGVHHSSGKTGGKDNWGTPPELVAWITKALDIGDFDLDPFASDENAKAGLYFTAEQDGYAMDWFGKVFMNPEYSKVAKALMKAAFEFNSGHCELVVALVAARPDTQWWWDAIQTCQQVIFLKGRVKFLDPDGVVQNPAPFPSALLIWDKTLAAGQPVKVLWADPKKDEAIFGYEAADVTSLAAPGKSQAPAPHTGDSPDGSPQ